MLFGALGHHGYDYYVLLRWLVCGVAAFAAYRAYEISAKGWCWVLAIVALFFNPVIPVHLERGTWEFIDVGVALLLLVSIVAVDLRLPSSGSRDREPHTPRQDGADGVE